MSDWLLSEADLKAIALGAGILGTGGGGSPYLAYLMAREQLRAGKQIRVIDPDRLTENDLVLPLGGIGAPTVGVERLDNGDEGANALEAIQRVCDKKISCVIADEIGGGNGLVPMLTAAQLDIPVVDADGMGRAFPETQMTSFFIYGQDVSPAVLTDSSGNALVVTQATSALQLENIMRAATVSLGCHAMMGTAPMAGTFVRQYGIPRTISQAWQLGDAVLQAQRDKTDPVQAIVKMAAGQLLINGKVVDVERRVSGGFTRGQIQIDGIDDHSGRRVSIDLQNEYLLATENNQTLAMVPDLICIVDSETGRAIGTEEQRYGLRVSILSLPAPTLLTTEIALQTVGPRAFGYSFDYAPPAHPHRHQSNQ